MLHLAQLLIAGTTATTPKLEIHLCFLDLFYKIFHSKMLCSKATEINLRGSCNIDNLEN